MRHIATQRGPERPGEATEGFPAGFLGWRGVPEANLPDLGRAPPAAETRPTRPRRRDRRDRQDANLQI